ncbi:MAG: hypothetical protein LBC97_10335 [Bifidobacteriaceae bacterium]|nr:hypothetical protein [Bifidobacteriaceae bacterium]
MNASAPALDQSLSAAELTELAADSPDLQVRVAWHRNVDLPLLEWLRDNGGAPAARVARVRLAARAINSARDAEESADSAATLTATSDGESRPASGISPVEASEAAGEPPVSLTPVPGPVEPVSTRPGAPAPARRPPLGTGPARPGAPAPVAKPPADAAKVAPAEPVTSPPARKPPADAAPARLRVPAPARKPPADAAGAAPEEPAGSPTADAAPARLRVPPPIRKPPADATLAVTAAPGVPAVGGDRASAKPGGPGSSAEAPLDQERAAAKAADSVATPPSGLLSPIRSVLSGEPLPRRRKAARPRASDARSLADRIPHAVAPARSQPSTDADEATAARQTTRPAPSRRPAALGTQAVSAAAQEQAAPAPTAAPEASPQATDPQTRSPRAVQDDPGAATAAGPESRLAAAPRHAAKEPSEPAPLPRIIRSAEPAVRMDIDPVLGDVRTPWPPPSLLEPATPASPPVEPARRAPEPETRARAMPASAAPARTAPGRAAPARVDATRAAPVQPKPGPKAREDVPAKRSAPARATSDPDSLDKTDPVGIAPIRAELVGQPVPALRAPGGAPEQVGKPARTTVSRPSPAAVAKPAPARPRQGVDDPTGPGRDQLDRPAPPRFGPALTTLLILAVALLVACVVVGALMVGGAISTAVGVGGGAAPTWAATGALLT